MAAKQGTLAQLSAQAEDAKRAVLSKAGSSWFSTHLNNNTVCTIKSAPPRSPEVLSLLATKAGWLYKRNEQHVWQARWCCVVPHTFLYYFDAPVVGNSTSGLPPTPAPAQQEAWNRAVLQNLGRHRKPHEKRSHFPLFNGTTTTTTTTPAASTTTTAAAAAATTTTTTVNTSSTELLLPDPDADGLTIAANAVVGGSGGGGATGAPNIPPAGIIDLECYTTLYQSGGGGYGGGGGTGRGGVTPSDGNAIFLQLAGDDQVNPDLRPFYFCSDNTSDVDEWNAALLQHRHSALHDEVEAYKQVADSFAQQLQGLHSDLDSAIQQQEESDQELYRVRSAAEDTRRTVFRLVEECWDRPLVDAKSIEDGCSATAAAVSLHDKRADYRRHMETIQLQDMGANEAVRLLTDYISGMEDLVVSLQASVMQLQTDVKTSGQTDQAEILELQAATEATARQHTLEKEQLLQELAQAQTTTQATTKELKDVQKDLSSTKMEVTMLMSQQRNKLATQQQHKKILKKEVIDLRQKVEDVVSEHSSLQHEYDKMKLQLEQHKCKGDLLTRYIDKMESQVQVQQNMMEMMSIAGGSVYGGGGMSVVHQQMSGGRSVASRNTSNEFTPNRRNNTNLILPTSSVHPSSADADDDDGDRFDHDGDDGAMEDFENDEKLLMQQPNISSNRQPQQTRRPSNTNSTPHRQHAHMTPRRGTSYNSDNDVDNKSHVSELTEDRTQREFTLLQHSQHHFPPAGYEPDAPHMNNNSPTLRSQDARFRKRLQEHRIASSPRFMAGPPSVIIGVKKNDVSPMPNANDSSAGNANGNIHELETIQYSSGSVRSLPVSTGTTTYDSGNMNASSSSLAPSGTTALTSRRDIPRSNNMRSNGRDAASSVSSVDEHHVTGAGAELEMSSERSTGTPVKLSVAQRSRREADSKSTPIRARLDESSLSELQRISSASNLASLSNLENPTRAFESTSADKASQSDCQKSHTPTSNQSVTSPQHSQGSGLWRRMEEAVLGPRSDDDEGASYTCSEGSTRITDLTDGDQEQQAARVQSAKQRFSGRDVREMEEKKSSDSVSVSNLSLQERCRIQRDKQLRFLREQGLLQYATDMKGGAGSVLDSSSVTSSSFTANGGGGTVGSSSILNPPR